ncbi:MAG: Gfo/Idh/MocA family oxidoreductase [Syntrophaceae bacterium]|nr:Gfo/Idh/MocA family oxidoreductase [Syntrophaceae bacterium]
MERYKAVIIGLGRIGQDFDYDQRDDSIVATHASAYFYHPGFELLAGVDPVPSQRERFEIKFKRPAYSDIKTMTDLHRPDVVSIAVPVNQHFTIFQEIIHCKPKAIICEKPIAPSLAESRLMQSIADDHQCALLVNYMRRFDPGSMALKRIIHQGAVGEIFKGVVWYGKGLLNNGTHFIDLLCYWLGDVSAVEIMEKGRQWDGKDPEPDICLHFGKAVVYVLAGRAEYYSTGEIDLFGSKGRIRYTESGKRIAIYKTVSDPVFKDYTILGQEVEVIPTGLERYQWHVLDGLYNHLAHHTALASDGYTASKTMEVFELACSDIKKEVQ